jgi:hypothetical protein
MIMTDMAKEKDIFAKVDARYKADIRESGEG